MGELSFSKNYNDLSQQHGVSAGFQFDFSCERCGDTWRSEFVPYRSGQASGWLSKAAGMFGGVLGSAGSAVDGLSQAGWGNAHDEALREAIEQAKVHFRRCAKCSDYICARCFNSASGLCRNCAPDAEVEIEAARAQGEAQSAAEQATLEGISRGKTRDVKRDRQLVCPDCGAETKGAKFCPECGRQLATKAACPACSAEVSPTARFCPECGKPVNKEP
jgi:hypothetical protein